jgi:hypothetical protein
MKRYIILSLILSVGSQIVRAQLFTNLIPFPNAPSYSEKAFLRIKYDYLNSRLVCLTTGDSIIKTFNGTSWTGYGAKTYSFDTPPTYAPFGFEVDNTGDIWFTSPNSVQRFNGTTVTKYSTSNCAIADNFATQIGRDNTGNLYFTHYGTNGVSKYTGSGWIKGGTLLPPFSQLNSASSFYLAEYNPTDHLLWIINDEDAFKITGTTMVHYPMVFPAGSWIASMTRDKSGNYWFASRHQSYTHGGLFKFDGANWTHYSTYNSPLQNDYVHSITSKGDTLFYWSDYCQGIYCFDGVNHWFSLDTSNTNYPRNNPWIEEMITVGDTIYMATDKGLLLLNTTKITGVKMTDPYEAVKVFPVPAGNNFHLSTTKLLTGATLKLTGTTGEVVKVIFPLSGESDQVIEISELPPGLYIIEIQTHNGDKLRRRIIKNQ